MSTEDFIARYEGASALLASVRDVIDERPDHVTVPAWCARRGWTRFLEALPDDVVIAAERDGLAAHLDGRADAPDDLVALARAVTLATALPGHAPRETSPVEGRRASARKRTQVGVFEALAADVAGGCARVVDFGSGHGHLTRHLARALGLPAVGWERDPARVAVANALSPDHAARFVATDAAEAEALSSDLVVGLHACGALGDHAVRVAAEAGAAVVLVGCCLQKREGDRAALGARGRAMGAALTLGRSVLGLGNARDGDEGVEADLAVRTASRVNRIALRVLLLDAGCAVDPGEEMRGVNRRRATGSFRELAERTFAQRGMPCPTEESVARAEAEATRRWARSRRWTLARGVFARLVEVWVALDRAALLVDRGYAVSVVRAFDPSVSPRNVAVIGRRAV